MNQTYSETLSVRATDCDMQRRMRLSSLFVAMQEGGERHATQLQMGHSDMLSRGQFFALARIRIQCTRAPRCGETIVHTTWPGESSRFFCPRYHVFALEDGTPLLTAGALWVILDVNKRSIVSPKAAALPFPDTSAIPAPIELPMRLPPLGEMTQRMQRTPAYSDYDVNGHVNNTRYIAWLCDMLGNRTLADYSIGEMTVSYEKEIREERPLTLSLAQDSDRFSFLIAGEDGQKHFAAGGTLRKEA